MTKRHKLAAIKMLVKARQLLRKGWCQWATARNAGGVWTGVRDCDAVAFCSYGAICAVGPNGIGSQPATAAIEATVDGEITKFNDAPGRTKRQVIGAFTRTIKRLERETSG